MRANPLPLLLVLLAALCVLIGILYAVGAVQVFTSGPGPHYKHLVLFLVLAVALLVGANFARRRAV